MKKLTIILLIISLFVVNGAAFAAHEESIAPNFSQLFDEHGTIMLLIEPQSGSIHYANQAASIFYGYTKEQLESMKISNLNTLTPEETAEEMQNAIDENRNYFVFTHQLANGDIRNVEVYSYTYGSEEKQLFSIIHDITAKTQLEIMNKRITNVLIFALTVIVITLIFLSILLFRNYNLVKKQKDAINNFNDLRQTFIDADDSLIYLKDENLKYLFVNKALERFYDKKSADVIGCDDFELTNHEFADLRRKTDLEVVEKNTLVIDEVVWKDRIFKTTKFPVRLLNGQYGVGAYIKDMTDEYGIRRKAEKSLLRNLILVDALTKDYGSTEEQLDYVLNESLKLTESMFGYIYLYDEEKAEFRLNSWSRDVMAECEVVKKQTIYQLENTGVWGEVVRQRKPIIIDDFQAPSVLKKGYPHGHVQLTNFMSIPLIVDNKIVAVVGLANKEDNFDENDIYQITTLMQGVWNAKERRETLATLAVEREKYLLTLLSIGDGVMVVDGKGRIEMLNGVGEKITGWAIEDAKGRHYKEVLVLSHESEGLTIADPIAGVLATDTVHELGNHAILTSKNGTKHHLEDSAAPIKGDNSETIGVVLVFRDVTEKKEQRKKIEYLSYHDSLTGLYNRGYFEAELHRLDTQRNLPISIIMGDVNGLKLTNDIFGHTYGDMLLQKVAQTIKNVCRADDIIARWGGDEFVILLPQTEIIVAEAMVLRIKDEFSKQQVKSIKGSISMGCAVKSTEEENIIQILELAEDKMYIEKTLVRNSTNSTLLENIINSLYEHYPHEGAHARRVSTLCGDIGKAMNLPAYEVKRLQEAGMLHDIGKISLGENLLTKNASLLEQEWKEIKQHPVVGYRILNGFDDTIDLAELVLTHHERLDGSGYPKGLRGEEIPKLARIIALAEGYDAMTNDSSYKAAMSKEDAIVEMQKKAGTQFDPSIVAIFVELLERS